METPSSTDVLLLSRPHQSLIAFSKTVASPCRARTLSTELDFGVALTVKDREIALPARHQVDSIVFARSSTHLGNSLVLFYPGGDTCLVPIPGSIKYIVSPASGKAPFYVVQRQLAASPNIVVDPFSHYPYFKAKMYSSKMGVDLEVVHVDWIVSHYAQWEVTQEHAVVLNLSRV